MVALPRLGQVCVAGVDVRKSTQLSEREEVYALRSGILGFVDCIFLEEVEVSGKYDVILVDEGQDYRLN